jgi:phosphoribosylamine--glycine ligase
MASGSNTVLVVGSGGREHALGWKISRSVHVKKVYFAPGNGGTDENIGIKQNDIDKLITFAKRQSNLLTIVGPEQPLSLGIVDSFTKEGFKIFGPLRDAAMIETSKAFAKEFMRDAGIPTAEFAVFTDAERAKDYVLRQGTALVVKADGLAAGKGVAVCDDAEQAIAAIDSMMVKKEFGSAGEKIVIEQRLAGEEVSFISICDGKSIVPLASSQDHKRIFDGDRGPNTGGMGAYSPAPVVDSELHDRIMGRVMEPAMQAMKKRGTPFKGFLYAGIMVDVKTRIPWVLEFNTRMGDPECQPIMVRMKSDLYQYIDAAVEQRLGSMPPIEWEDRVAVCIIMAARGYPGKYEKGMEIEGLDSDLGSNVVIFHAGTTRGPTNRLVTNGGRVLGVTASGKDTKQAVDNAYYAVRKIRWGQNDYYYRTDIASRSLLR